MADNQDSGLLEDSGKVDAAPLGENLMIFIHNKYNYNYYTMFHENNVISVAALHVPGLCTCSFPDQLVCLRVC